MPSSKVSPSIGLNGFHVRSLPGNGPIVNPTTQASLHQAHVTHAQSGNKYCLHACKCRRACSAAMQSQGEISTAVWIAHTFRRDLQSLLPFQGAQSTP